MAAHAVHWNEGMFLRPQHFQAAQRHFAEAAQTGLKITVSEPDVKSAPPLAGKKTAYTRLTWDVTAKGDEYHLVDFLHHFYAQPLLHQVKSISIQPSAISRKPSRIMAPWRHGTPRGISHEFRPSTVASSATPCKPRTRRALRALVRKGVHTCANLSRRCSLLSPSRSCR